MGKMKVTGLSTGRIGGNSEILLKEALMGVEENGVETEIIRAMELDVRPCKGCESCTVAMARGKEPKCVIKDDVPWILERVLLEDTGLIISVPTYHLRANAYFEIINERMLPVLFGHMEILKKTRVGAIIAVGGGEPEWTPLTLTLANIFIQHTRKLVDQIQLNFCGRPGSVLLYPQHLEKARELGRNVARAMMMPIEEVKYVGEEGTASCPVCHCNVLKVPGGLPEVYCPVCWVKGDIALKNGRIVVKWDEESTHYPRLSERGVFSHLELVQKLQKDYYENIEVVKKQEKKYAEYGKIIRPEP